MDRPYLPIASQVRAMFDRIAPRYDLGNSVLSFGLHHLWKRKVARQMARAGEGPLLDLCCGTGDIMSLLTRRNCGRPLVGLDFAAEMLRLARSRIGQTASLVHSDALSLPFPDGVFRAVTVSFGVRNFESVERGLQELRRVLRSDGELCVLEFGQPGGVWGRLFNIYSRVLVPLIGGLISGDRQAYRYLHETSRTFPSGDAFRRLLHAAGFAEVEALPLAGGIAYLYLARRPAGFEDRI